MGMVELNGLAVGPYTVIAPITARPCYYHRTLVWEWQQSGKNKRWVKVAAESAHVPFFLDDNTAKVMIDPRGADLDLHRDFQDEFCDSLFTTKEEVPANVRSFLSRHGVCTTNKIKVEEFCIKPKNALFVLGTLDENPGLELTPEPIQDDDPISSLRNGITFSLGGTALSVEGGNLLSGVFTGGLQHDPKFDGIYDQALSKASAKVMQHAPHPDPAQASDATQQEKVAAALMKAHIVNLGAWATAGITSAGGAPSAAGVAPARAVNTSPTNSQTPPQPTPADFDPNPPVVLMKGKNNPTFLISWRSQRDLASSLGWKCAAMIWGGPALALLCLYALLTITHLI